MKKISAVLTGLVLLLSLFAVPVSSTGAEASAPALKLISFKNATLDEAFKSDVLEYKITLEDNTVSPTLESYETVGSPYDSELFVTYVQNDAGMQTGIQAALRNSSGSGVNYVFIYSNPAEYEPNSNSYLTDIYCNYAELDREMTHDESSYKLYIPKDLNNLVITPVTEDVNASCPQLDITLGKEKVTPITLTCTASDGSSRAYKIKIKRIDKTLDQVKAEMQEEGYTSFVEGTHFYQNPSFYVIAGSAVLGVAVLVLLYKFIRRFAVNPYDPDEKPFYSTAE